MDELFKIIIATCAVSLISLTGLGILWFKEKALKRILLVLVSLSAGVMLGSAFLHLLPEAIFATSISENSLFKIFLTAIGGLVAFFILEQFITWHHCHKTKHQHKIKSVSIMVIISDGIHNFIDGLAIAASFIASPAIGVSTTIAIALHEIPQEIGDFGVLIYGGFSRSRALLVNLFSALVAVVGGVLGFYFSKSIGYSSEWFLPFAAGNFIYIAAADLIPEIKHKDNLGESVLHFIFFIIGIGLMVLIRD